MPATIPDGKGARSASGSLLKRIAWFIALYVVGVLAVGIVAYGLRLWIKPAAKSASACLVSYDLSMNG